MSSTDRSPELPEQPPDDAPVTGDPDPGVREPAPEGSGAGPEHAESPPGSERPSAEAAAPARGRPFLSGRKRARPRAESVLMRLVSTAGIVGVSVAIAAILGTQDIAAWIIGLVVSVLSVVLAAVLWSSRTL